MFDGFIDDTISLSFGGPPMKRNRLEESSRFEEWPCESCLFVYKQNPNNPYRAYFPHIIYFKWATEDMSTQADRAAERKRRKSRHNRSKFKRWNAHDPHYNSSVQSIDLLPFPSLLFWFINNKRRVKIHWRSIEVWWTDGVKSWWWLIFLRSTILSLLTDESTNERRTKWFFKMP